jgi:hypothetical protein
MSHYHVYVGPKNGSLPKDVFSFETGQQAIDKVMDLIQKLGHSIEEFQMAHEESPLGRFSVILVPSIDCKIVLHECNYANHKEQILPVDKSKLN